MAGIQIEGNLDNISEIQLAYIKDVLEKRGYKDNQVTIAPVGIAGDNYVANVQRITVDDNGKQFKIVAKVAPTQEIMRMTTNTFLLFKNEHIMYTKVMPKFEELQTLAGIPEEERLRYAECYGSFDEAPNEVILLEDLNESNYTMQDRLKSLNNECVQSVLKNFAKLHALSFALKHKEPETFNEFKNSLFDMWAGLGAREDTKEHFYKIEKMAIKLLQNDVYKKAIKGIMDDSFNKCVKLSATDRDSKTSVIVQGDSWTNNIMFKYDGEGLVGSIMIDYQLSKVSNPASDLHYMLFNCTDYKARKEHFYDWIDYYYKELEDSLAAYDLKANYVFPRDQLDVDMKRYGKMHLGLSLVLASVVLMKPEEAGKMKEAMAAENASPQEADILKQLGMETIGLFKSRIEGLIDSYQEFGLL